MSDAVWFCAYMNTVLPGKSRDDNDCPMADYPSHRHLPSGAVTDACGWFFLVPVEVA